MAQVYPINDNPPAKLLVTLFRLNGALLAAGDRLVADLGLTSARWQVLGVIAHAPVPLPIASIARNIGLTRQAVRLVVGELIKSGLVRLEINPHHQRARLVVLTPDGIMAHAKAQERWTCWTSKLAEGMTEAELLAAGEMLQTMLSRVDTDADQNDERP